MIDDDVGATSISVVEETATITTREVTSGGVRLRTETEADEKLVRAELAGEDAEITRVAVNRPLDALTFEALNGLRAISV